MAAPPSYTPAAGPASTATPKGGPVRAGAGTVRPPADSPRPAAPPPRRSRLPLWLALSAMALLTLCALVLALGRWEHPVPGLLTDPMGRITNYGWPGWNGYQHGLSFPDTIVAVDDIPLPAPSFLQPFPAVILDQHIETAPRDTPLRLSVLRGDETSQFSVKVDRLGWAPFLVLFGGYTLLAWIWLFSAGLSYLISPESPGVGAFTRWALLNAVVFLTIFDWHTTRTLVPFYVISYAYLPAAVIELGLRFPDDAAFLRRQPGLIWGVRAMGAVLLVVVVVGWSLNRNLMLWPAAALGLSIVALAGVMGGRCLLARGRRRTQLLMGLSLWMPVYLCLGWMLGIVPWPGPGPLGSYLFLLVIPVSAIGTVGITYALVRYDFWDARSLLPRRLLRPLLSAVLGLTAALMSSIVLLLLEDQLQARWVQVVAVFFLVFLALPLHRTIENRLEGLLFPADAFYRPTIEQLSLRFTDLASRAAVVETVETTVRQWLPCDCVRFLPLPPPPLQSPDESGELLRSAPPGSVISMLNLATGSSSGATFGSQSGTYSSTGSLISMASTPNEPPEWRALRRAARAAGIDGIGSEQSAALCSGQAVQPAHLSASSAIADVHQARKATSRQAWARLILPARYRDHVVGLLAVSSKRRSQLFTSEDENLLRTIANQAALALACANAYEQVESLRRAQQAAFREEKGAALGTVAAEIAHEIRFPINFFRMLLESYTVWLRDGKPPETEDVEIGREEVDRLERMAGNLRRIATTRILSRQPAEMYTLVDHVRLLLRDRLMNRVMDNDVDPLLDVDCDKDAMTQILVNLLANALDACEAPGRVGMGSERLEDGRMRLTVWDTGPGLVADVGKLFQPWFTTKKTGSGLGLAITRRLVRAHGWEIGAGRRGEQTCFDVVIPREEWHRRMPPISDEGQFESGPLK